MISIELQNNSGYAWVKRENVTCKGYAFVEGDPVEGEELARLFFGLDREQATLLARDLNGFFSVVIEYEDGVLALVDHVRSFPLFYYSRENGDVVICDGFDTARMSELYLDADSLDEFSETSYMLGKKTIFSGVKGIEAGDCILAREDGTVETLRYYEFNYADQQVSDLDLALKKMEETHQDTFKRLIKYLDGRTAVIPLSGGHDSRLIAYYLVKLGYKNIVAFSYGDAKTSDSQISRQAAEALGLKYYYVPYTRRALRKGFKEFKKYMVLSCNGVSYPALQTWYAVYWLRSKGVIDENCVVCPGYGGVLPGHYVATDFVCGDTIKKERLIKLFEEEFFSRISKNKEVYPRIKEEFLEHPEIAKLPQEIPVKNAAEVFERWIYREDQAKAIQNSNRIYEYYGLKWATPLFDKEQFSLWLEIDNSLRYRNFAFKEMEKTLFEGKIKDVPFTGGKETVLISKERGILGKCLHLADICLRPHKYHYMNRIVPYFSHVYRSVVKRTSEPILYVRDQYIKYVKSKVKGAK